MSTANCGACGNVRKSYQLDRHALTVVGLLEVLALAGEAARPLPAHKQLAEWTARVVGLLPADGRTAGEQWRPPERSAIADDWARLGAFHGALDGWAGTALVRLATFPPGLAWGAYVAAYWAAHAQSMVLRQGVSNAA